MRLRRLLPWALVLLAWLAAAMPVQAQVCAVPGSSGAGSVTGIVNTYYPGSSSVSAGSLSIPVGAKDGRGSATDIAAGDLLLVIQLQDASISTSNSSAYGGSGSGQGYTGLNSSGLYEYVVATGPVSAGSVPIASGLLNSYAVGNANSINGQKRFQVIRVPQYSSATLTGTVTAPPWDGSTGGVVAFDVAGSLNWAGQAIDVNGRGFRGGGGQCSAAGTIGGGWANTDYVTSTFQRVSPFAALTLGTTGGQGTVPNAAKGEGIAGTPIIVFTPTTPGSNSAGSITSTGGSDGTTGGYPSGSFGRGAPGNAGGGGTDGNPPTNDQNTGGAGGGNYGIGGKGGYGWTPLTPPGFDTGGFGGMSVPSSASRIFFGGGGGAGATNNCTPPPGNVGTGIASSGAAGGGMVFVRAGTILGGGTINARGTDGDTTILNDASGGGGAGGSALIFVNNAGGATGTTINVQGGRGGCNTGGGTFTGTCLVPTGGSPHGPGGGGSGGFAITSGSATFNIAGGGFGVTATSTTSTLEYGSSSSVGGFQITTLAASDIPGAGNTGACFPQLTVVKTTSTPTASAGTTAAYSIVATNAAGKQAATSVTITDPLPGNPNITYASTTSIVLAGGATRPAVVNPTIGATSPAWGTFSIPGGGAVTINFIANLAAATPTATYQNPANVTYLDPTRTASQTVTPGGTYTAGGTVSGSNYNSGSSTGEDVTVVTAATISKSFSPGAVSVGASTLMSVVIGNPGTVALANVGLVDNYPAGMVNTASPSAASSCGGSVAAAPSGGSFTLTGAAIPAGGTCTITVNVTITSPGPFTNTIPAGALTNTQGITNTQPGTATLYSNVTIAKSFSPNAVATNTDSTLTLVLTNANTIAMTLANPGFTDSFPAGLVATGGAVTATGCGAFAPATISGGATSFVATAGTIAAGGTCTVSFAVRSATPGVYSNTSSGVTTTQANTTGPPSNAANLGVGLVNVAKAFSPSSIVTGGTSTVTLTLTNPSVAQTNASFSDTLVNMSIAANQSAGGTCTGAGTNNFTAGQTSLAFSGISIPATSSCTVTFTVTSATVGNQNNTTSGVSTALLPAGPTSNTATLAVLARPTIAKAFAPATVTPGTNSTLTFTISNSGPQPLSGMSFTDTYPAGLVNATALTVGGTCTGVTTTAAAGGGTFNVTAGNIPAAASCTITVAVNAATAGSYANTASGVATTQTGSAGPGSNTATLFVAAPATIAKAFGTSPIAQGATSVATFTLANANTIALTNLNFTDALSSMTVASTTIGGTCAGTTHSPALVVGATALNLTVPTLAAGASCTVTVTLTSSVSGTHPNTASGVTSTQTPVAGAVSNTATLVVLSPPTLQKNFSPGSIQSGETTSIVFTLTNPNATALANVTFSDPLANMQLGAAPGVSENCAGAITPSGVTAGSTSFSLTLNTLNASETCTITVSPVTSTTASPAGGHANTTSTVTSTQTPGGSPGATGYLNVLLAPTITKSFSPSSVSLLAVSTITFTLTNPNSIALTNVTFTDAFPQAPGSMRTTGAQNFIGGGRGTCTGTIPSAQGAVNQTSLTLSATTLAPNSSCTIMVDVQATVDGVYTNTTTGVTSNQTPTAGATATDVLTRGGVSLAKSFSVASIQVGASATLTFTLVNNSGANQSGLQFTDPFPAGMTAVGGAVTLAGAGCSGLAPNTVSASAGAYNLTGLTINSGSTCTISLAVQGTTSGVKSNVVTGTGGTPLAGRTDTATLTVYAAPTIAKSFSPATIAAGGTSALTLTLANPNAFAALTGAAFTDTLANMAVSGAQTVGGTCAGTTPSTLANGATNLSFTGITIPAGGTCTVTIVVTSSTVGVQPNTASGVTTAQTPTAGANSGAVNLTVGGVNITKAFANASRPVGVPTTLTITLTSTQSVAWSGLAFTDTLPANLVVASPANEATTCGAGTVTASPGTGVVSLSGGTMAAGASPCTVSVSVVSSTVGGYTNATANFSGLSAGLSAAGASATVTYFPAAAATKAFAPATIAPNGTTTLTFTLTNPAGAQAVTGLGFTDTLPAGVTVAATPAASNTCGATFAPGAGASVLTLSGASLGAGVASCTAQVNVTASVLGTYTNNSSNLSALAGGLTAATANASFSVAGTTLTKAFNPTAVGPGVASTLTFTITNGAGNPAQSGLAFTDTLPTNLVVASPPSAGNTCGGTFTPVAGAGSVSLSGGSLAAAQASCTVSVNVSSAQVGTYVNDASNISATPASMDKSGVNATLNVLQAPGASKAFGAASVAMGGATSLTLTFSNANTAAATGLAFTDTFPTSPGAMTLSNTTTGNTCGGALTNNLGGAIAVGSAGIRLTGGSIPGNGSCTITVNVTASAAGSYTNTIGAGTITTANAGSVAGATSASVTFVSPPAIGKSFAGPLGVGRSTTLTFTIQNTNTATALTGVAFADTFPVSPGAMVVATPPNPTTAGCGAPTFAPTAGAASITFSGATIAAGATCTVTVDITASVVGTYNNTSGAVTATGPVALTGGTAAASLSVVQAALTKLFVPSAIDVNGISTLTFTMANGAGSPAQSGISFTDTLPANVVVAATPNITSSCPSGTGGVTAAAGNGVVTVTGATMNAAQASCTITVDVTSATAGTYNNTNAGNISAAQRVTTTGVSATLTVSVLPTLTKAFATANLGLGQTTTLAFSIANTGTNAVNRTGLSFTDTLPAGLTIANPPAPTTNGQCGAPAYTAADGSQPFTASSIAVNAGQTCTITITVRGATLGAKTNNAASITAISGINNGVAPQTVTVVQPSLAKTFGAAAIDEGATTTLVFTLANGTGNPAQSGIALGDTLPAGLRFTTTTPAVSYGAGCSGPASAAYNTGSRVLSGLTGIAMTGGTAGCTVTVAGLSNEPGQAGSCPAAAFTNLAASVSATGATNVSTDQCLPVQSPPTLTKAFAVANVGLGQTTTLAFSIANTGTNAVNRTGLSFTDTLPAGLTIANPPAPTTNGQCGAPAYTAADGSQPFTASSIAVNAGQTCTITITVRGATLGAKINGAAQISAISGMNNGVTDQTLTVTQASLTKAFVPSAIDVNGISTLTFTLTNGAGNPAQSGIGFTDTLPAGVVVAATPNIQTNCPAGGAFAAPGFTVTAPAGGGSIAVSAASMTNAVASCQIRVDVTSATAGTYNNTDAGNISAAQRVTTTGVSASLTVSALPALTKAFSPTTVGVGQNSVLTFTITNPAGAPGRTGLTFTDTLPAGAVIGTPNGVVNGCGGAPTITATPGAGIVTVGGAGVNAAAGPSSCTVTVNVASATAGAYVNGAAQITAISGMNNGVTDQTLTVTQASLTKAFAPATIDVNGISTLTFTLANGAGNPAQSGINFTDTLPANVVVAATPNITSSCPSGTGGVTAAAGSGVVTVTGATMNAAQASCTITVDVTSATAGTYNNTNAGNISAAQRVTTTGVSATLTVQALPTLTKAFSPATVGVGQNSVLTFTITNPAGAPGRTGLTFTDTLPAGAVIGTPNGVVNGCGGAPTITATPGAGIFTVGGPGVNAAAGPSSCTVTVNVASATAGAYVNGAAQITAISGMNNGVTNQALTVTQASLTKAFAPATIDVNGISTLTFTLANGAGNPAQSGINFTDTLPAGVVVAATPNITSSCPSGTGGVTAAAGNGVVTVTGATMNAAQASCTITVDVTSATAGIYNNTNAGNISAAQRVTTTGVSATLTVSVLPTLTKAFATANLGLGQTTTLAFSIANTGTNAVNRTGLSFTDTLPAGLTIANPPAPTTNGQCGAPAYTAADGSQPFTASSIAVNAGQTCTITLTVRGATLGAKTNNAASITAISGINNGVTDQTLTVTQASLTKAFVPSAIDVNGISTLTFTLANGAGNPAQSGINFTDTLPANVVVAATPNITSSCPSGTGGVTAAAGSGVVTVTGATMNAAQASCTITVDVTSATAGTYNNTDAGNISAAQRVTTTGVSASLTVSALPALTKAFSPTTVGVGQNSVLTFTITNPAGAPGRTGLTFTDTLPAGAVIGTPNGVVNGCGGAPTITATPGAGIFTVGGPGVNAAAGPSSCTVTVNVASATAGAYVNGAAQITAISGMNNGVTNQTLTVTQASLTKLFVPSAIDVNGISTLTFTLTNGAGNPAQSGIGFTDTLPAGVVVAATPSIQTNCPAGGAFAAPGFTVTAPAGGGSIAVSAASMTNAVASCQIRVDVTSATAGTYNNTDAGNISAAQRVTTTGVSASLTVSALPALTKAFSPTTVGVGQNSVLTFTITNPAGAPGRTGLTFTDTLPAGAVIGTPNGVVNGCGGAPTITATPGAGIFTVGGPGVNAAAGPSSCTVTVNVASATAGAYVNGAAQITAISGMNNGVTNQTLTVTQASLTKLFVPSAIDVNGISTLTFTLTNGAGNPAQSGIGFTDTLPANVVVAATPNIQTNCPAGAGFGAPSFSVTAPSGGGSIAVSLASLGNAVASCQVRVDVTSATAGTYNNTDAGNISAAQRVTTTGVSASLTVSALPALTKAFSPTTVGVGQNSVLTFTITNPAGAPGRTGLTFTDTLPAGAVIGTPNGVVNGCGGAPTITATPGAGIFTVGGPGVNAAAGPSSCTVTVNVASATAGAYVNGAAQITAISGMNNGVTDQTLTVLSRPTVTKAFGAVSIPAGGTTTLTITLANANAVPITGVAFTDVFPAAPGAMTLANTTTVNTCAGTLTDSGGGGLNVGDAGIQLTGGTIPAGGTCVVTVNVTAATPGTYTNTLAAGSVTSANAASNPAPASANLVVAGGATIAKAFSLASIAADGTSTITFTLSNANAVALTAASFTDTLANMSIFATGPAGGSCAGAPTNSFTAGQAGLLSFTGLTIPASGSCTVSVVVTSDVPGAHDNQASGVSSAEASTGAASNIATLTVTAATPSIAKAFAPATIAADGTSTMTFTLANTNGVALTSAQFTDTLANIAIFATGPAGGSCAGASTNSFTAGQTGLLAFTGLTIPANGSCTVTAVVTSDTPGVHNNTASGVSSTQAALGAASNTATLTVNAVAPAISKAFAPSTIAAGANSTITFALANTLGVPLTGGAFTDTLVNMSISVGGAAGGTCAGAGGNSVTPGQTALSFTGLTVPANGSCTVTVVVTSNVPGPHNNTTSALTSNEAPASAVSNTAVLTVTAVAPSISKAFGPATIVADATSTVTLTISNPLGIPLTSANFSDTLASMWVATTGAAGGTCAGAAGNFLTAGQTNVSITGLTVPATGSCTVTIVVTSDLPGIHPNQASGVSSTEAPTGAPSNSASLTVTAAPPTIVKAFAPASIVVNATSTITFTLSNANGIALTGAGFTDTLANMQIDASGPAGGTCAGAGGNAFTAGQTALTFAGLTVPINGSCTVTVVVASNVIGTHPNQASGVSSAQAATGAASNTANLTVQPMPPTIAKQFLPASIVSGGVATLRVTIGNPNPSAISVTSVTDTYPGGMTTAGTPAQSTTCAGGAVTFNASSVTLTGGAVAAGGSCNFQISVTAAVQGSYTNTIPVGALTTSGGFNTSAASATLTVDPVADLAVVKNAPASIGTGQVLNYTISVVNNGPDAANGAQFSDNVPAQVTGVGAVCGAATGGAVCGAVNVAGNAVTSTVTTLPAGASVTFTISGTASGLGPITNTANVVAPGGVLDPAAGNNSSSANTTILAPDLTITKTHAGNFTVGVNGTYTITVSNGAGSLATSGVITVVDTLPAGLTFVSGTGTGWSCGAAAQTVTCTTPASIAAGAAAPAITLAVAVASTAVPSVLNTVTVSGGGEPAAAANNNTASDNTIVNAAAVNTFAPDNAQTGVPGSAVFYPHTFNAGLAGAVAFSTSAIATPAVPGWSQTIYRDTNCNGTLDGAEGAAPLAGAIAVNPGDAVCIIVRDSIPGAAPYNAQNVITVTSTFNGSQTISRTDVTTVGAAGGAGLTLSKTVRNVTQGGTAGTTGTALPNDIIEYTISYLNTSAGPVSAIVIADATPSFTLHQSAACGALPANLTACNVTSQPPVNGTGSVVWTLSGTLLSGGSGSVTYQVRVSN